MNESTVEEQDVFWRMPSSKMWRRVDLVEWTYFTKERIASIFRVEKSASEEPAWAGGCRLATSRKLPAIYEPEGREIGSSLADFSTLKVEAIRSSETSVQSTRSTQRHIPEDDILHSHRRENLKSYMLKFSSAKGTRAHHCQLVTCTVMVH
jgi:hypothetical protein